MTVKMTLTIDDGMAIIFSVPNGDDDDAYSMGSLMTSRHYLIITRFAVTLLLFFTSR